MYFSMLTSATMLTRFAGAEFFSFTMKSCTSISPVPMRKHFKQMCWRDLVWMPPCSSTRFLSVVLYFFRAFSIDWLWQEFSTQWSDVLSRKLAKHGATNPTCQHRWLDGSSNHLAAVLLLNTRFVWPVSEPTQNFSFVQSSRCRYEEKVWQSWFNFDQTAFSPEVIFTVGE